MKPNWWTEEHKERMQYRDDLVTHIAARCKRGQRVMLLSDSDLIWAIGGEND